MSASSSLETEAMKRKERLLMMKRKLATQNEDGKISETTTEDSSGDNPSKKPTFRSYNPSDESLKKDANVVSPAEPVEIEDHVQDQMEFAKETPIANDIDLTTLAPRKIDWDLKRDTDKKLRKLERRTQRAIADLIRERLASGKDDLLLSAVNSNARAEQERHSSDDDD